MSDCCDCTTMWEVEVTKWIVLADGIKSGGSYLSNGPKPTHVVPGCAPGGAWKLIGQGKQEILNKNIEKMHLTEIKRELTVAPYSNGDCINTTGGIFKKQTLLNEETVDKGLCIKTVTVPNVYPTTYWRYPCGEASIAYHLGYERFKYFKRIHKVVYKNEYEANHTCGRGSCCAQNENVDNIWDREQEYETWVGKL